MKKLFAAVAAFSCIMLFAGCNKQVGFTTLNRDFYSMNTTASLVVSDRFTSEKKEQANQLIGEVGATLNGIHASLSATDENSYVGKFNSAAAGEKVEIDAICFEVLSYAKRIFTLTDSKYNPAVYYSVYEYGFHGLYWFMTAESLPDTADIEKYVELSSHFGEVELSQEDGKYYALKPSATVEIGGEIYSMKIDLGGIGKGYAVDKVNALLDKYEFVNGYFNFGSSSMALKNHYLNGVYSLGLASPRAETYGQTYFNTELQNVCLSTSGDNEQYYEIDGRRYCHVIDPSTGEPVQTGIMSVTILGGSAAEDDALTTAVMCMGKERAVEFINENLSDRKVVFTYDNGGAYEIITNMPAEDFTFADNFTVVSSVEDGKIILGGGNVA